MSTSGRPTPETPDDDPHLWLEAIDDEKALQWVERQNGITLDRYGDASCQRDCDVLTEIFDRPDNIPFIRRRGGLIYNFWTDADHPRGIWRRTTLDNYRRDTPDWDVLLDLDDLASREDEDWIWHGASTLLPEHDRAMLRLSRGGSDAVVLREFDLGTKSIIDDGFYLPEAKGGVAWLDRDTLLLFSALGEGMATTSGYSRTVRLWHRKSDVETAPVLFETDVSNMGAWADVDRTAGREDIWFCDKPSFFEQRWWIGDRTGPKTRIDLPTDAGFQVHNDWLVVRPRKVWTVGGRTYAPDTVLGLSLSSFLEGDRDFHVLFEAGERRSLQGFSWSGPSLVLSILDDLAPVFEIWSASEKGWKKAEQPDLPRIAAASLWSLDVEPEEANGDLIGTVQTPVIPTTFTLFASKKAPEVLKQAPSTFDSHGLHVSRHEAVSIDGERIPYTQVGPKESNGNEPVHLSGYGGFRSPQLPHYRVSIGKLWLERGGTSVIANIRGGGEFGTRWHEAGRREKKPRSHDDFAAVADDLVKRGVTRPERIAAEGGSNGGILITNMLTRYPQHFGALFCTIPLIDMRRYTKLLAGASWIDEYGDPDKPEDWAFLQHYSAYHTAKTNQVYPPILLATSRRDDRVHPGHARKMTAKLQEMGYTTFFYEPAAGGHGYGKNNRERASFIALGYRFLRESIGWVDE